MHEMRKRLRSDPVAVQTPAFFSLLPAPSYSSVLLPCFLLPPCPSSFIPFASFLLPPSSLLLPSCFAGLPPGSRLAGLLPACRLDCPIVRCCRITKILNSDRGSPMSPCDRPRGLPIPPTAGFAIRYVRHKNTRCLDPDPQISLRNCEIETPFS